MKSEWGISDREAEDLGNTILSISVSAVKPN
jgi:hypothetical protein